jgi:hypothetical protein
LSYDIVINKRKKKSTFGIFDKRVSSVLINEYFTESSHPIHEKVPSRETPKSQMASKIVSKMG